MKLIVKLCMIQAGLEIRILEPGAISLKIAGKLLPVQFGPSLCAQIYMKTGAFYHPAGANFASATSRLGSRYFTFDKSNNHEALSK